MSNKPLGWVTYADGLILAELLAVDRWRVTVAGQENPAMARTLAGLYEDHYKGPQDGHYGQLILNDLAEKTGGVAVFNLPPPSEPGTVY